jgi:hypothetical protein
MRMTVTADLVARFNDSPNELWLFFCNRAKDEECGSASALIEQFQDDVGLSLHPGLEECSIARARALLHLRRIEAFLNVDGQGIDHADQLRRMCLSMKTLTVKHAAKKFSTT